MASYKQQKLDPSWDAIVIGSGMGGLVAAAALAKYGGRRVLVLERHYTAGGYTHTFHRPGYEWDVGVHYVGEMQNPNSPLRAAFDNLTGGQLEWQPMPEVYDRIVIGDKTYDLPAGRERLRSRLKSYFPGEAQAIDCYLETLEKARKASDLFFAEKAVPGPVSKLLGGLMRAPFLRWAGRTTGSVLADITDNRELAGLLTAQWGDYGLPPAQSSFGIHAIVAGHYFEGASYPVGGAARIAATITPLIESTGGQVVVSADVTEILLEQSRAVGVRMADGNEFRAPLVISDAGARNTFERLVKDDCGTENWPVREQVRRIPSSMACLSLYVGIKQSASELGLSGTNLWVYSGPDHDAALDRFRCDPDAPFPVLFISFPSAKDPDFERRHPGHATIEVLTAAPYDWFERWETTHWKKRGADYEQFKQKFAARMQRELERIVPQVAGRIDYAELSTPLSTRHFTNHERGEAYGLAATPERFRAHALRPQTPLRGLYLTGADAAALGVAGTLMGGLACASAALGRNLVSKATRRDPGQSGMLAKSAA